MKVANIRIPLCFFLVFLLPLVANAQFEFTGHILLENIDYGAALAIDDINQDSANDMIATCSMFDPSSMMMWWENQGNNNYLLNTIPGMLGYYEGAQNLKIIDIDNDGDLDVFVMLLEDIFADAYLLENDGNMNFTSRDLFFTAQSYPGNFLLYDYENDGDIDVLHLNDDQICWEINNGQAEFLEADRVEFNTPGSYTKYCEFADFDYDGDPDIICSSYMNSGLKWYENLGNNDWEEHILSDVNNFEWNTLDVRDFDNDGDYDIAVVNDSQIYVGGIRFLLNNGDNTFQSVMLSNDFFDCFSIQTADFDLDGDYDILATSYYEDEMRIWEYLGGLSFTEHLITDFEDGIWETDIGDLEGDGDLDIISYSTIAQTLKYWTNNWNPFALQVTSSVEINATLVNDEDINDTGTTAALHPEASDGWDEFTDLIKEVHAQNDYVTVYFPHPEWNAPVGDNFEIDVRDGTQNLNNTIKEYDFIVETDFTGSEISLDFIISEDYPDEFGVVLVNLDNGQVQNLKDDSEYTFLATNSINNFELRLGDATAPNINIVYPYTNQGLYINQNYILSWQINDVSPIQYTTIDFSIDGGQWARLDSLTGAVESFEWISPGTLTQNAQLRIGTCDYTGRSSSEIRQFRLVSSVGNSSGGVHITASTELSQGNPVVDEGNLASLSPEATDGFDPDFDIPKPPPMFNNYLQVFFPHPEWQTIFGDRFMVDVRDGTEDLINGVKTYIMNVSTDIEDADVNLTFDINDEFPQELGVVVKDLTTDEYFNLRENSEVDYVADDTLRQFELYLGDALDPEIEVTFPHYNEWLDKEHTYTLHWEIADVSPIRYTIIEYAIHEGSEWVQIDSLAGSVESINWETPFVNSEDARLRITAADVAGHRASIVQPFRLTILNPPEIDFLTFTESDVYELGSQEEVAWEYSNDQIVTHSTLSISVDDGQSWVLLDAYPLDTALDSIVLPDEFTAYARLKVDAWINTGEYGTEISPRFAVAPFEMEHTFTESWHLVSTPLLSEYASIDSIFGDNILSTYYVFRINQNQSYIPVTTLNHGYGYWLALEDAVNIDIQGTPQIGQTAVSLHPGWNLVGTAIPGSMTVDSLYFELEDERLDYNQAAASGWIVPALYTYQGAVTGYSLEDNLNPWYGYAMFVHEADVTMSSHPPYPEPPADEVDERIEKEDKPTETEELDDQDNWLVNITVNRTDNTLSDYLAAFGVVEDATIGYDAQYDLPRPPNPPDENWLRAVYLCEDWPLIGDNRFIRDVRSPLEVGESCSWDLRVESTQIGATRISFDGIDELPGDLQVICSRESGDVDLRQYSTFTFVPEDGLYEMTITVTRLEDGLSDNNNKFPVEYSINSLYPNPFNSSLNISIGLPQSSDLIVRVYNVLGQQVAILADEKNVKGFRHFNFNAEGLSSGIYFINAFVPGEMNEVRKIVLVQ